MQKVLIANPNVEQRIRLCQQLANDKRLEVIETADGKTALEKYLDIKPNVLVLDSCLKDINCIEIIDRLSTNIADKKNNNIILTAQKEENLNLSNAARIYKVIYDDENFNDFYSTINEMYLFGEYGTVKIGGTSTNNIDVWQFADETEEDGKNKGLEEVTSNVYGNGHTSLYTDVIDAIEKDRRPYVDAVAGRNALELVLAIYKSQKEQRPVKLPLDEFTSVEMTGEF